MAAADAASTGIPDACVTTPAARPWRRASQPIPFPEHGADHAGAAVEAGGGLVASGRLLTVAEQGITSSRLDTLGGSTWLAFA